MKYLLKVTKRGAFTCITYLAFQDSCQIALENFYHIACLSIDDPDQLGTCLSVHLIYLLHMHVTPNMYALCHWELVLDVLTFTCDDLFTECRTSRQI